MGSTSLKNISETTRLDIFNLMKNKTGEWQNKNTSSREGTDYNKNALLITLLPINGSDILEKKWAFS